MTGVSTQSSWRSFRVVRRETLSKGVTGFTLFPTDAGPVTPYLPGQGVSVRATVPEAGFLTSHPFALTHASSPEDNTLTFAVEKIPGDTSSEGRLCRYLTEEVHTGAVIEVSAPTGEFTIDTKETMPVVFLADRLGIAPVFTMVDALAIENPGRSVTVLYSTTDGEHFPLEAAIRHVVSRFPDGKLGVFFSKPRDTDEERVHYDVEGEIDVLRQKDLAFVDDADYFVAGPAEFVKKTTTRLAELGVIHSRIHAQTVECGSAR